MQILDGVDRLIVAGKEAFAFFKGMGEGFLGAAYGELKDLFEGPLTEEKLAKVTEAGRELGTALGKILDLVVGLSKAIGIFGVPHWDTSNFFGRYFAFGETEFRKNKNWIERVVDLSPIGTVNRALTALQASPERADELLAQARGVTATPPAMSAQALAARSMTLHAPVSINVDARGATPETASHIGEQVKKSYEQGLASSLEILACHE